MSESVCPRCLRCVYPVHELQYFGKVWSKSCYDCQVECDALLDAPEPGLRYPDNRPLCYCINPSDISSITISQISGSELLNHSHHSEYQLFFNGFISIDPIVQHQNKPSKSSDDNSSQKKAVMEQKDIDNIGYWLPGNESYRAMDDYTAQDSDEVSFRKGDLIINCQSIDKSWMTGVVQRTGKSGMLPANSVQPLTSKVFE